jgi:hypothetical protein
MNDMQAAIESADLVIHTTSAMVANHCKGMLAMIAKSKLEVHGFYAVVVGGKKVCFVDSERQ